MESTEPRLLEKPSWLNLPEEEKQKYTYWGCNGYATINHKEKESFFSKTKAFFKRSLKQQGERVTFVHKGETYHGVVTAPALQNWIDITDDSGHRWGVPTSRVRPEAA